MHETRIYMGIYARTSIWRICNVRPKPNRNHWGGPTERQAQYLLFPSVSLWYTIQLVQSEGVVIVLQKYISWNLKVETVVQGNKILCYSTDICQFHLPGSMKSNYEY